MITAHFPSGYLLSRAMRWGGVVMAAAVIGATWPDLDLIWFYHIDDRAFHHHKYWVHAPTFALACTAILLAATQLAHWAVAFSAGWGLHILPDAPTGGIMWFWPLSDTLYYIWEVPATRSHWILSFVAHWSFIAEVLIWFTAFALLLKRRPA